MLPEGDYLYKDLSSEFVDLEKLFDEIREEKTSGYLSFESEEENETGFAVLDRGSPGKVKVLSNGHERIEEGRDAIERTLKSGSYAVQVVDCDESAREIVNIKLENEKIKTDISAKDIDVSNFLATNLTDQENDCHIILISDEYSCVITMVDGIPTQAKFSKADEIFVGNDALDEALEEIERGDVTIDIYEMTEEESKEHSGQEETIGERMEGELEGMSEEFEDKADDLLDDMGLGVIGEEENDSDAGGGDGSLDDIGMEEQDDIDLDIGDEDEEKDLFEGIETDE